MLLGLRQSAWEVQREQHRAENLFHLDTFGVRTRWAVCWTWKSCYQDETQKSPHPCTCNWHWPPTYGGVTLTQQFARPPPSTNARELLPNGAELLTMILTKCRLKPSRASPLLLDAAMATRLASLSVFQRVLYTRPATLHMSALVCACRMPACRRDVPADQTLGSWEPF